jgi:hypothetical protein
MQPWQPPPLPDAEETRRRSTCRRIAIGAVVVVLVLAAVPVVVGAVLLYQFSHAFDGPSYSRAQPHAALMALRLPATLELRRSKNDPFETGISFQEPPPGWSQVYCSTSVPIGTIQVVHAMTQQGFRFYTEPDDPHYTFDRRHRVEIDVSDTALEPGSSCVKIYAIAEGDDDPMPQ